MVQTSATEPQKQTEKQRNSDRLTLIQLMLPSEAVQSDADDPRRRRLPMSVVIDNRHLHVVVRLSGADDSGGDRAVIYACYRLGDKIQIYLQID